MKRTFYILSEHCDIREFEAAFYRRFPTCRLAALDTVPDFVHRPPDPERGCSFVTGVNINNTESTFDDGWIDTLRGHGPLALFDPSVQAEYEASKAAVRYINSGHPAAYELLMDWLTFDGSDMDTEEAMVCAQRDLLWRRNNMLTELDAKTYDHRYKTDPQSREEILERVSFLRGRTRKFKRGART